MDFTAFVLTNIKLRVPRYYTCICVCRFITAIRPRKDSPEAPCRLVEALEL